MDFPKLVVVTAPPLSNPVLRFKGTENDPIYQHTVAMCYDKDEANHAVECWNNYDRLKGAMLALESLTSGGSEFVGDTARCVEHVRERQTSLLDQVKRFKLENDRLKAIEQKAGELADWTLGSYPEEKARTNRCKSLAREVQALIGKPKGEAK